MARFTPFMIDLDGRSFSGDWELDGELLRVNSAYGSSAVRLGRADPEKVARAELAQQVEVWLIRDRK